eukprot:scaffold172990_cov15-Tisochrysis_lutea.AAC.1
MGYIRAAAALLVRISDSAPVAMYRQLVIAAWAHNSIETRYLSKLDVLCAKQKRYCGCRKFPCYESKLPVTAACLKEQKREAMQAVKQSHHR